MFYYLNGVDDCNNILSFCWFCTMCMVEGGVSSYDYIGKGRDEGGYLYTFVAGFINIVSLNSLCALC